MAETALLRVYDFASATAALIMPLWLRRRVAIGKESATRWRERYGQTAAQKPSGPVIWCHAASVGETTSILPLIKVLAARGHNILLTTGTVTSEQFVRDKLPAGVTHQFAPLDHRPWLRRFFDHWQPMLALRVDSELWPNTILMLRERSIPVVQVNARISHPATQRWARIPEIALRLFGSIELVLAQSEADRARYEILGAKKTSAVGNLKLAQPELPYDPQAITELRAAIGPRPVWLAASIHPGEDDIVGTAQRVVMESQDNALLIIVPRHPERATEMAKILLSKGLSIARRGQNEPINRRTQVYIADTMGELGLFYRLAKVVFIGKSFSVGGGQNPAEAALLRCALAWGPDMSNFAEIASELIARQAALEITIPSELGKTISRLLADPARVETMGQAASNFVSESAGTMERVLDKLAPYLSQPVIR